MEKIQSRVEIEIQDREYKADNVFYSKTAVIKYFDNEANQIALEELGFVDQIYVQEYLQKYNELQLDYCVIQDFSLEFLKESNKGEKTILSNFSAKNSIFYSPGKIVDFSNILFESEIIDFHKSIFICNQLTFEKSVFFADLVDFSNVMFKCDGVNFSKIKFTEAEVSFKNSFFNTGIKDFQGIEYFNGKAIFINVDFGNGDVFFTDTDFNCEFVSFKVAIFGEGRIDFSRVKFANTETAFEKTNFGDGDITFRSADFRSGKVNFTGSMFGDGKKSFINTNFGDGNIYFKNTNFGTGNTSFRLSVFGHGSTDFHYCEFGNGSLQFDRTSFLSGGINMKAVNFGEGKVSFNKIYVAQGDIIFEGTQFKGDFSIEDSFLGSGEFNFRESDFSLANVYIHNVDFGIGKISFHYSSFKTLSLRDSQLNNYFDLQIKSCEFLDLSNTVVKDILDINPPNFDPDIKAIDLSGMRLLGRIYIDWRRTNLKQLIYNQNTTYKSKEEQFRILKENYNVTGRYTDEDEAYVEFKRTEAIAYLKEGVKKNPNTRILVYIQYYFKKLIFDKMGKYATDPLRVLLTMVITYVLFTLVYILLGQFGGIHITSSLFAPDDPRTLGYTAKAFYHSAVTFLTIGYGDYYPDGINRWISGFEGFMGLFLMSYFTVAFVRKILR
jgi:hypothetical protein